MEVAASAPGARAGEPLSNLSLFGIDCVADALLRLTGDINKVDLGSGSFGQS